MSVSADGLSAIVAVSDSTTSASDLKLYTRSSKAVAFGTAVAIPGAASINSTSEEGGPRLTRDGLMLFFQRGSLAGSSIYLSTRASLSDYFGTPSALDKTTINANTYALGAWVSPDDKFIYWSLGNDTRAIYSASITASGFTNVATVSTLSQASSPVLTDDMLTMYIASAQPDVGSTAGDVARRIWKLARTSVLLNWSTPSVVPELDDKSATYSYDVSPDGCIIYYKKGDEVYQATKPL